MNDLISRQAAIDALDEQIEQCDKSLSSFDISMKDEFAVKVERASLVAFRETLEYLPSAQTEIIRCKDCKNWGDDDCPMRFIEQVEYDDDGYIEHDDIIHDYTKDDGFCDRAERRDVTT